MRFKNVSISACAYHLPERIVTSDELEEQLSDVYKKLGIPKGRLQALTGIKERRVWPNTVKASDLSAMVGEKLLSAAKVDRKKISLLIHTGVCRDFLEPATASIVHHRLGLDPHCMVFDLSNACVAFLNGMVVAASMIELGQIRSALLVTGENSGPIYRPTIEALQKDPNEHKFRNTLASLTLGSAAVAYLLQHRDDAPDGHRLVGGIVQADSSAHDLCKGSGTRDDGFQMETDTQLLMKHGLLLSQVSWELFKSEMDWSNATPDHIITHQISLAHQQKVFELLKLDSAKGYSDLSWLGNTGSAAAPMSLVFRKEQNAIGSGDKIALLGIGSGLNTVMLGVEW